MTELKKTEKTLFESEEKFRLLFETSQNAIFIASVDGLTYMANKAAEELFGYTQEEFRSLPIEDIYAT